MSNNNHDYQSQCLTVIFERDNLQRRANEILRAVRSVANVKAVVETLAQTQGNDDNFYGQLHIRVETSSHNLSGTRRAILSQLYGLSLVGLFVNSFPPMESRHIVKFRELPDMTLNGVHLDNLTL